jgi:hypothetical protein
VPDPNVKTAAGTTGGGFVLLALSTLKRNLPPHAMYGHGDSDLGDIGARLKALGDEESEDDLRRMFEREDLF